MEKLFIPAELMAETPVELLRLLHHLFDDYRNEIPDEIVSGRDGGTIWKCQKNWFQNVVLVLRDAQEHLEAMGKAEPKELEPFLAYVTAPAFGLKKLVTEQDVLRADEALSATIKSLES